MALLVALYGGCATNSGIDDGPTDTTSRGAGASGTGGGAVSIGSGGAPPDTDETCDNGLDDDGDGEVDEECPCTPGESQVCCNAGTQTCVEEGEFSSWGPCVGIPEISPEVCDGATDEDCDGEVDEGCGAGGAATGTSTGSGQGGSPSVASATSSGQGGSPDPCAIQLVIDIDGDCVTTACPPEAPFPVGCNIVMDGNDDRGCVANNPGSSTVYFQEGDNCGAGHVGGTLTCSCNQGAPLSALNCDINKQDKFYGPDPSVCPET